MGERWEAADAGILPKEKSMKQINPLQAAVTQSSIIHDRFYTANQGTGREPQGTGQKSTQCQDQGSGVVCLQGPESREQRAERRAEQSREQSRAGINTIRRALP